MVQLFSRCPRAHPYALSHHQRRFGLGLQNDLAPPHANAQTQTSRASFASHELFCVRRAQACCASHSVRHQSILRAVTHPHCSGFGISGRRRLRKSSRSATFSLTQFIHHCALFTVSFSIDLRCVRLSCFLSACRPDDIGSEERGVQRVLQSRRQPACGCQPDWGGHCVGNCEGFPANTLS